MYKVFLHKYTTHKMKRTIWIFSLAMLLFSIFTPSFTYATGEIENEAKEILSNTLEDTMNIYNNSSLTDNLIQSEENYEIGLKTFEPEWEEITVAITWDNETMSTFTFRIIKIWKYNLMDRNLWATKTWYAGYYYQWWNNYWFSKSTNVNTEEITEDTNDSNFTADYWTPDWVLNLNWWWDITNTYWARKWPCPSWWHVPSQQEWNDIYNTWYNIASWSITSNTWNAFKKDLILRDWWYMASFNNITASLYSVWNWIWSSTSSSQYSAYQISWWTNVSTTQTQNKRLWYNVRCTQNPPIIYNANWWYFSWWLTEKEITYNYNWTKIIPIYNIQIPDRASDNINQQSWWMFAWRYTKDWTNNDWWEEFDITNPQTTIAYAKWLSFNDLELSEIWLTWIYIMDRNLWAEDIAVWTYNQTENSTKLWYYFQWWNNYWFKNTKNTYPQNSWTQQITNMEHSTNPWGPGNYYYSNKFIKISTLNANRESSNNKNLWWWESSGNPDRNKKWPCPAWYHIPDTLEWKKIHESFINETEKNENYCNWELSNTSFCFAKKLKLPYAWSRNTQNGWTMDQWIIWRYWTSSPYSTIPNKNDAEVLKFDDWTINSYPYSRIRTNGYSIRCIKDSPIKNINYITDWWKEVTEVKTTNRYREEEKILPTTSKDYYTFEWWYTTSNYTIWSKVETNNIETDNIWTINLYAKRLKNPEIVLKTNWWKFSDWKEEKTITSKDKYKKRLQNENSTNKIVRKVIVFTWAESIHLSWTWSPTCNDKINIYNCDKEKNNECNIYKQINANCWPKWCFFTDEDITWDTITIEAETGSCNATPTFNYKVTPNWKNYYEITDEIPNIKRNWYEFLWWYEENSNSKYNIEETPIAENKTLYAQWKGLEEKAQETATESVIYTNETTVTVWNETTEEVLSWSTTIELKTKEVESEEVKKEEEKTKVQESEIKVTSDKTVEYEWWLEVYLEKKVNEQTEIITWTAKFSAPIAVKIPVTSDSEYVKVQVKHYWEEFWYTWLTLNPENECQNWVAVNNKYNWEDIKVKESNWEKYVLIYTCSASTFVAYSENKKPVVVTPAAWGWRTIKQESKVTEQEHNSADIEETTEQENNKSTASQTANNSKINEQVKNFSNKSLTRWEVAVMTNILLEVYPQLVEGKTELNDVTNACSNYADEQNFTKDEKKAITRLCKLSIMWIHRDNNEPLDEFLVKQIATNWEFATVMDRVIANYTEKDLSVVKDALKKLENNDDWVVFGTVYDVFMSIKNIFN